MLRPNEEYLSTNWLEFTGATSRDGQISAVRSCLERKFRRLPTTGQFAVLQVGMAIHHVLAVSQCELSAHHEGTRDDPSHAGLYGFPHESSPDHQLVADLLARMATELHPTVP